MDFPFMGQKRRFITDFKEALKAFSNATVFIDLFGGSGLLSYVAKQARPDARVVYNDYHERPAYIGRINALLADLRVFVTSVQERVNYLHMFGRLI